MSLRVLDTDVLSLFQRGHIAVCNRVQARPTNELATTVITVEEQLTGWYTMLRRSKTRRRMADMYQQLADQVKMLAAWTILPFPEPAIVRYEHLLSLKLNIGKKDLRIAAIVLEIGAVLVSRNLKDFQRVPGLVVENWTV